MDEPLWSNERISQYAGNSPTAMEARRMFDAMVRIRDEYEARLAALEQAPAPALEVVPDGEYFNGALIISGRDIGLLMVPVLDHYQWLSSMVEGGLPEGWVLMRTATPQPAPEANDEQ